MTVGGDRRDIAVRQFVIWLGMVASLAWVFFIGGTYPWMGNAGARLLTQLVLGVPLLGWVVVALRDPEWRPHRAGWIIVTPILVAGVLSVVGAKSPRLALEAVYWAALVSGTALLLVRLASLDVYRVRIRLLILSLYFFVLGAYLTQIIVLWLEWIRLIGGVGPLPLHPAGASLTFGATPATGMVLLVLCPPSVAFLMSSRRGSRAIPLLVLTTGFATLTTGSRSVALGGVMELLCLVIVDIRRQRRLDSIGAGRKLLTPRNAVGVTVAAIAAVAMSGPILRRLTDVATVGERIDIWRSAIAVWWQSPWFGAGAGSWPFLRASAYPPETPSLVVPHAHNPAIQLLAETGVVGLLLVALSIAFGTRLLLAATRTGTQDVRRTAIACLVGLVGFATGSILDDFVNLPAVLVALLLPISWVFGAWLPPPNQARAHAMGVRIALVTAIAALAVTGPAIVRMNDAALTAADGVLAMDAHDWTAAKAEFESAVKLDPEFPLYRVEAAVAATWTGDLESAARQYELVGDADGTPVVVIGRAWVALEGGDNAEAARDIRVAYARATGDATALLNVAAIAGMLDDHDLAVDALAGAMGAAPQLTGNRAIRASPDYDASLARALGVAKESGDPFAWDYLRAYSGDAEIVARELALSIPSGPRDRALATCLRILGRNAEASALLVGRLEQEPLDGPTAQLLSHIRADAGDPVGAARFDRWSQFVGVGSAALSIASGSAVGPVRETLTSNLAYLYPWAIYWRLGPAILTPPDAVSITE